MAKDLQYYRALPYTRRIRLVIEDGEKYWIAWVDELSGCKIDAPTKEEAFAFLDDVFDDYIAAKLEWKSSIAEPQRSSATSRKAVKLKSPPKLRPVTLRQPMDSGLDNPLEPEMATTGTLIPA